MPVLRGALIVVEGIDRTGKSTQCRALVENLKRNHIQAEYTNFPDRSTEIGKVVNSYLQSQNSLPDEAIHLLFSANRWERAQGILQKLEKGISVIVDRYCYSGVAFSAAKGLDVNWCKTPDIGLPKPDKVFFLTMPIEVSKQRTGFGQERYEVLDFQKKVLEVYTELKEDNWEVVNADRLKEDIEKELLNKTMEIVKSVQKIDIGKLWID